MDGAKLITDIANHLLFSRCVVGRRFIRIEVFSQEKMDLIKMKILVVVRSKQSDNL